MTQELKTPQFVVAAALFLISGATALIYEVLWMKQLALLFGNSAQAAAATLAAFFAGIAAGNAYWGRRSSLITRPLRVYGLLEVGVMVSALLYFAIVMIYDGIYQTLFSWFETTPVVFTLTKFVLSFVLFFPAAFFMGGTLPVMTQYLVRSKDTLGKRASTIYAINTLGAAAGATAAGFVLPQILGYQTSYIVTMFTTLAVALVALAMGSDDAATVSKWEPDSHDKPAHRFNPATNAGSNTYPSSAQFSLAALSGFATLALQVLWIRMFAQVLHNSVYTYAAILSIFLIALALGGLLARELARRQPDPRWFLPSLMTLSSMLVASSPILFNAMTDGGTYIGGNADFSNYMIEIMFITAVVIGIPVTALGILLPYLFKLAENEPQGPGNTVGTLVTINTVAAIIGSVAAGFILLDWLGLWSSLRLVAALYVVVAVWLVIQQTPYATAAKLAPVAGVLLLITMFDTSRLPLVRVDPVNKNESLLKVWEGADATVAVVRQDGFLRTKLNNWYTLGSTGDMTTQQVQTHLPMLLHKAPKHVFYLGLGTGITPGTALNYEVEKVVVTEISTSAIEASREFFGDYTNGLFDDTRVSIIADDGRNALRGTREEFDLIISDLFIPWKAGTGTLYSVEHYRTAQRRLRTGGLYAQWVPLYQVTQEELAIIARTMLEVFPTITLWRGNFWGERAVLALIGHREAVRLELDYPILTASKIALQQHLGMNGDTIPLLAHYSGQIKRDNNWFNTAPLNTDNKPVIEYLAPINHRLEKAGRAEWFVGEPMLEFMAAAADRTALDADNYISELATPWHYVIQAGYYLHASYVLQHEKHPDAALAKDNYRQLLAKAAREIDRLSSQDPNSR